MHGDNTQKQVADYLLRYGIREDDVCFDVAQYEMIDLICPSLAVPKRLVP